MLPVSTVRDLSVYIDSHVTLRTNISDGLCFAALRQIRSVRCCFCTARLTRHSSVRWLSASSTATAQYWPVFLIILWTDCTALTPHRHRLTRPFSETFRARYTHTYLRSSLVVSSRVDQLPSVHPGISVSQRHDTTCIVARRAVVKWMTSKVVAVSFLLSQQHSLSRPRNDQPVG